MVSAAKKPRAAVLAGLLVLVAVAGSIAVVRYRSPAKDHAVHLVPPDANTYLHVFLKPSTSQRRALGAFLDRFPETDEEEEAKSFVNDVLRDVLARFDVNVDEDAGEWLGDEAAAYLTPQSELPTMILAVEDEQEARAELSEALGERLDRDLRMSFVDGFMVIGSANSVAASISTRDDTSIADVPAFGDLVDGLHAHRLAMFFTRVAPAAPNGPVAATLRVTDASVVVDAVGEGDGPWRSVRGFTVAGLTGTRGAVTFDLSTSVGGRGIVAAARSALVRAGLPVRTIEGGFRTRPPFPLPPFELRRASGTVSARVGEDMPATSEIPAALDTAARMRLGDDFEPAVVVDVARLPAAARTPFFGRGAVALRPPLEQVLTVDLGVRRSGSHDSARLVLTFSDA